MFNETEKFDFKWFLILILFFLEFEKPQKRS